MVESQFLNYYNPDGFASDRDCNLYEARFHSTRVSHQCSRQAIKRMGRSIGSSNTAFGFYSTRELAPRAGTADPRFPCHERICIRRRIYDIMIMRSSIQMRCGKSGQGFVKSVRLASIYLRPSSGAFTDFSNPPYTHPLGQSFVALAVAGAVRPEYRDQPGCFGTAAYPCLECENWACVDSGRR